MSLGKGLINVGLPVCRTDSVYPFGPDNNFTSNIVTYELNGDGGVTNNVPDTTTNNNGTATSVTYSSTVSKFGSAAAFDGYNSEISANNVSALNNLTKISVSFWFRWDDSTSISNYGHMINIGTGSLTAGDYFGIAVGDDGGSFDRVLYGYFVDGSLSTGQTVTANVWHHVVVTYVGTTVKYYYDGSLIATHTRTSLSLPSSGNHIRIGSYRFNGSHHFKGYLDQIRIFDREINAYEVATLYGETTSTASSINPLNEGQGVALYTLDFDSSESGDLFNGTPTNVTFGVGGQINYGARFNGDASSSTSSRIDTGYTPPTGSGNFSISCWLNWSGASTDGVWSTFTNSGTDRKGIGLSILNTGRIDCNVFDSAGLATISSNNPSTISTGQWVHVVVTYEGGLTKMYINKTLQSTTVNQSITSHHTTLRLGQYYASIDYANMFEGDLDQVRIFESVLSQSQVDTLYDEVACVHTATANTADFPSTATTLAHYPLDNSSEDNHGNTYDGTDTDIEYRFGRYGQAAVFNGSSSKIALPSLGSGFTGSSARSISAWVKISATPSSSLTIFNSGGAATLQSFGFFVGTSREIIISYYNRNWNTSETISLNTWHHIVFTYNGGAVQTSSNSKVYIDGTLATLGSTTGSATGSANTSDSHHNIGVYGATNALYFDGDIDQVRLYSTVLDSDQVSQLYNEKPEIDTSNFKAVLYEGNGTSGHYISNVGINLDVDDGGDGGLVWLKNRTTANSHCLFDTVRGANFRLLSNSNGSNTSVTTNLTSFDANGFFLGNASGVNGNNNDYVAWVWKGGGDAVTGTGSGVSAVSVSANTEVGFSIVKYTGGNSASDTVNHGLTDAEMIILKDLDDTNNWRVWHKDLSANHWLYLNLTNAEASAASDGGIRNVDSNSFGFINGTTAGVEGVNSSSSSYIAYVWKSKSGYSRISSYTGTGASHTLYTTDDGSVSGSNGFEPSFLIIKRTDSADAWQIYDNKRGVTKQLMAQSSDAEYTQDGTSLLSFNSNGFTLGVDNSERVNKSSATYLYAAFK